MEWDIPEKTCTCSPDQCHTWLTHTCTHKYISEIYINIHTPVTLINWAEETHTDIMLQKWTLITLFIRLYDCVSFRIGSFTLNPLVLVFKLGLYFSACEVAITSNTSWYSTVLLVSSYPSPASNQSSMLYKLTSSQLLLFFTSWTI